MNSAERHAWLEARRNGIGSSDVPKILGLSQYGNRLDVYNAKVTPAKQEAFTGPQEWGHRLEAVISAAVMDHTGWKLEKVPTLQHKDLPFLIASPDRVNQDGEIVEIKTSRTGSGFGEAETSEVPDAYWIQCQHQLEVAGRDVCWLFVLISGSDFRRYRIAKDQEYLPTVKDELVNFWKCVETKTPPDPDWDSPTVLASVNRLFQPKPGTSIELANEHETLASDYTRLGATIKELTEARDEIKARLIYSLGEFELGCLPNGGMIARTMVTRKSYTVNETTYPDFRVKLPKGAK